MFAWVKIAFLISQSCCSRRCAVHNEAKRVVDRLAIFSCYAHPWGPLRREATQGGGHFWHFRTMPFWPSLASPHRPRPISSGAPIFSVSDAPILSPGGPCFSRVRTTFLFRDRCHNENLRKPTEISGNLREITSTCVFSRFAVSTEISGNLRDIFGYFRWSSGNLREIPVSPHLWFRSHSGGRLAAVEVHFYSLLAWCLY